MKRAIKKRLGAHKKKQNVSRPASQEVVEMLKDIQESKSGQDNAIGILTNKVCKYQALVEFGQIINMSMDYKKIHKKAVTKLKEILDCDYVFLYRNDSETNELFFSPDVNPDYNVFNKGIDEVRIPINENSLAGYCAHHMATIHSHDCSSDLRYKRGIGGFSKDWTFKNMVLAPLVHDGELIGILQAADSHDQDFSEMDVQMLEAAAGQMSIAVQNVKLYEQLHNQFVQTIEAMAEAIGKKDRYTGGHTKRVGVFSEMIAYEMDLPAHEFRNLRLSGVLHDIGKIGIEDAILKKPGPLTKEESEIMHNHPAFGYEILKGVESLGDVIDGVRYHHERPDGKGYPYGMKQGEIPVIASIISVADTFDAMISTRPYRKGLPPMVAYHEIRKYSGTQFDTRVADAFVKGFKKTSMYKPEQDEYLEQDEQALKKAA